MTLTKCAVAVAAVLILAGCSTSVSGTAVTATAPAGGGGVDVALLDPGNYPTKPRPPLGNAGDPAKGAILEANRMANNVLGPWEVDVALVSTGRSGVIDPSYLNAIDGEGVGDTIAAHNFVTGFGITRSDTSGPGANSWEKERKSLTNMVLRFATPEDAAAAAAELTDKGRSVKVTFADEPIDYQPVPVPRHPGSTGLSHNWEKLGHWVVKAFTAHGPYVLYQYASSQEGAEAAAELIATTLDKQGPLIDTFQPTPADQLAGLPIDPDGLLARTLPPDNGTGEVYQPHAQLLFDSDPIRSQTVFDAAHLQLAAKGKVNVYQTPDAASAQKIVDGFAAEVAENGLGQGLKFRPAAGVKGLPDAKCLTYKGKKEAYFYCLMVVDRYAVETVAIQEGDAHQRVAAQYLMLTSK